jgi:hypothetical protein
MLVSFAAASTARADNAADAKALFDEARAHTARGEHAAACPLYEQSLKLALALGTQLNLAECLAHTGRLREALVQFRELETRATAAKQAARVKIARDSIRKIDARMPRVTIAIDAGFDGKLTIDETVVEVGAAIAVDPGSHRAEAIAADGRRADKTWIAAEATNETIRLELPAKPTVATPPPVVGPGPSRPPTTTTTTGPPPPTDQPNPKRGRRRAAWIVGGTALVAAAASGGLVFASQRDRRRAIDLGCQISGDFTDCPDDASADVARSGRTKLLYGTIAGGTAVALGAVSIYLFVTSRSPATPRTAIVPVVDSDGGGIVLERRW